MAASLASRAATDQTNTVFRRSLNFLRSFSTASSPTPSPNPNGVSSSSDLKKRKKKGKNLIEVAHFLPNWGIGYHMAKTHWKGVSYEITKINLYKSGRHGKAWGIAHKDGLPAADAPKKISGVHKRCWRYISNVKKSVENTPSLTRSTESVSGTKVEAAS